MARFLLVQNAQQHSTHECEASTIIHRRDEHACLSCVAQVGQLTMIAFEIPSQKVSIRTVR